MEKVRRHVDIGKDRLKGRLDKNIIWMQIDSLL